ncbi:hypothetical protein RGUI_2336 [Rhodovulum sp. P5]|uniref:DUF2783 domain-containing protein n=1 Tax=Rhodovulum sp. P5 TaxID=1564506 RepID=UPI0009C38139|nr:DUF2783 domain-containing protein [Rhodovulum sp. P5]ARE40477.1 hypothetical protein RGUI_2336 [Rhodovulum sp. P5]
MKLITTPNLDDHDGFYTELLSAHRGLSEAESHALNAQLILILANHIGDREVLSEALELANPRRKL